MSSALLTSGFPVAPDFCAGQVLTDAPELPAHTENDPFGYRFRAAPEPSDTITGLDYDPESQLGRFDIRNGGGGGGSTNYVYLTVIFVGIVIPDTHYDTLV
jgi:hypothetical protein